MRPDLRAIKGEKEKEISLPPPPKKESVIVVVVVEEHQAFLSVYILSTTSVARTARSAWPTVVASARLPSAVSES